MVAGGTIGLAVRLTEAAGLVALTVIVTLVAGPDTPSRQSEKATRTV
jgi:hypothetical protein